MKAIFKVFFLLLIYSSAHGQGWTKNISNNSYSSSNSITILDDTLFISDNSLTNAGIIKVNNLGQFSSGKKFNNILRFSSLIKTSDNNLVAIGNTTSPNNDIIVLKLSKSLNLIWSYQLSLPNYQFPEAIIENSNGGFTICGFTSSSEGDQTSRNGLVLKLSNSGSLVWAKTISKSGSDYFSGLTEGPSGKILLTGVTTGNVLDISLVQISSNGNLINTATWGGSGNDGGYSAIYKNGKYYVSGNSWSTGSGMQDMILLKFDTLLNKEFSLAYGSSNIEPGLLLKATNNGKLILAGQSSGISTPNKGRDICVLFLNDDGTIISMKNIGGPFDEFVGYGYKFIEEYNNNFYVVGSIPYSSSKSDILLSKINSNSVDSCCNTINDLTFTSTISSIAINNTNDLTTNTISSSISYTNSTFNTTYNLDTVCLVSLTPLSTTISTLKNVYCQNEVVQFNGSANLSNVQFSWNFNDPASGSSNISNSQNTSHSFSNPGIYNIVLKAKNACKEAYDTIQITIKKNISYSISTLPKLIYCKGDTVRFNITTNDSTAIYTWNFDDPNSGSMDSSNLLNPYHIFSTSGYYTISLKSNMSCLNLTDTVTIKIIPDSLNLYFNTNKLNYCKNEPIQLSYYINTNSSVIDWLIIDMSSGNQTSILNNTNPIITISDTGLFKIIISTRNQCGFDSDSLYLRILDNQWIQPIISSNNLNICIGDTAYFSAIADTLNRKYYWSFGEPALGNGDTSKLYQANHVYNSAGTFLVIFHITNDCGLASDSLYITVNNSSNLNLKIANTQFSYCVGANVPFAITMSNTNAPVIWDFDDPLSGSLNSSTSRNPFHKYNTAGVYIVKVYSKYLCSSDTDSISIVITDYIDLNASIQNTLPECVNDTIQFYAISTDSNCIVYWDFGDPSSGTNNNSSNKKPKHVYTSPGIYEVKLLSINNCLQETDTIYVELKNTDLPEISYFVDTCSRTIQLNALGTPGNNYEWVLNDSISISMDTANFKLNYGTNIIKLIRNPLSICSDSITQEIVFQELESFNEKEIPNVFTPNNDGINDYYQLSKEYQCEVKSLTIYNRWGIKVFESTSNPQWDGKYNGKNCDQGNYIAFIELSNKKIVKFIDLIR